MFRLVQEHVIAAEDDAFMIIATMQFVVLALGSLFFVLAEHTVTKVIIVIFGLAALAGIMRAMGCL